MITGNHIFIKTLIAALALYIAYVPICGCGHSVTVVKNEIVSGNKYTVSALMNNWVLDTSTKSYYERGIIGTVDVANSKCPEQQFIIIARITYNFRAINAHRGKYHV
jgi:hypothetical protein